MNEREMQSLLALAAKRLHTTPEALRAAAENGDLQNITGSQNNAAASQLNRVLSDPEAAKKLLSTPAAQKLFEALGGKIPQFAHLPLLTGKEGKLSKRLGSLGVRELREEGVEALAVCSFLAKIGLPFMMGVVLRVKKTMDPRLYNGAMFVGLNGLSVKSHGGTDALGFSVAVSNAANLVRQNFVSTIRCEIEKLDLDELSQEAIYDVY